MRNIFTLLFGLFAFTAFSQITGNVIDADTNEPLIGATVQVQGTSTGTVTDLDGNFNLKATPSSDVVLVISYTGFLNRVVRTSGAANVGSLKVRQDATGLNEIVIAGTMDIAEDRKTPVAVSTITAAEIQLKAPGNVEFPEVWKNTPSIFVGNQNGGYGDGQVFTRGFDQSNTAFLLNGQPINGMEDGKMYWSNWSGLMDVATAVQVQRGLGASKLAISSVGGTTNVVMKATDLKKGGWAGTTMGNNNYQKMTAAYNTGLIDGKWGVSALVSQWSGDGYAYGTQGSGQNYFLSAGYKINSKNSLNFLITGAPQMHDQKFSNSIYSHEIENEDGEIEIDPRYNSNWGTYQGQYFTERRNYYHKPVANLNWAYEISDKSKLSTVLYASWGRGGGTGGLGSRPSNARTSSGLYNFDNIAAANDTLATSTYIRRASVNNHNWVGTVINYEQKVTNSITASVGTDLRTYQGTHFRQVSNLYGGDGWFDNRSEQLGDRTVTNAFKANPWSALTNFASEADRIAYDYSERISYGGVFGQLEYSNNALSAYVQGAVSSQSHVRWDRFNYDKANEKSETVTNPGYNVKGGANYNIDDHNGVFVNAGFYSRQPFHDNLYLNFGNDVNPVANNEEVLGLELGYTFRSNGFDANVNGYYTSWGNRTQTRTIDPEQEVGGILFPNGGFTNLTNINQIHSGVELDFSYDMTSALRLRGFASIGDWVYDGFSQRRLYDENRTLVSETNEEDLTGFKVGGSAQTSFGAGLRYNFTRNFHSELTYNYYDRLTAVNDLEKPIDLPAFGIADLNIGYMIPLDGGRIIRVGANIYNLFNELYINSTFRADDAASDVETENWNGVNKSNSVTFGKLRNWNVSIKYQF